MYFLGNIPAGQVMKWTGNTSKFGQVISQKCPVLHLGTSGRSYLNIKNLLLKPPTGWPGVDFMFDVFVLQGFAQDAPVDNMNSSRASDSLPNSESLHDVTATSSRNSDESILAQHGDSCSPVISGEDSLNEGCLQDVDRTSSANSNWNLVSNVQRCEGQLQTNLDHDPDQTNLPPEKEAVTNSNSAIDARDLVDAGLVPYDPSSECHSSSGEESEFSLEQQMTQDSDVSDGTPISDTEGNSSDCMIVGVEKPGTPNPEDVIVIESSQAESGECTLTEEDESVFSDPETQNYCPAVEINMASSSKDDDTHVSVLHQDDGHMLPKLVKQEKDEENEAADGVYLANSDRSPELIRTSSVVDDGLCENQSRSNIVSSGGLLSVLSSDRAHNVSSGVETCRKPEQVHGLDSDTILEQADGWELDRVLDESPGLESDRTLDRTPSLESDRIRYRSLGFELDKVLDQAPGLESGQTLEQARRLESDNRTQEQCDRSLPDRRQENSTDLSKQTPENSTGLVACWTQENFPGRTGPGNSAGFSVPTRGCSPALLVKEPEYPTCSLDIRTPGNSTTLLRRTQESSPVLLGRVPGYSPRGLLGTTPRNVPPLLGQAPRNPAGLFGRLTGLPHSTQALPATGWNWLAITARYSANFTTGFLPRAPVSPTGLRPVRPPGLLGRSPRDGTPFFSNAPRSSPGMLGRMQGNSAAWLSRAPENSSRQLPYGSAPSNSPGLPVYGRSPYNSPGMSGRMPTTGIVSHTQESQRRLLFGGTQDGSAAVLSGRSQDSHPSRTALQNDISARVSFLLSQFPQPENNGNDPKVKTPEPGTSIQVASGSSHGNSGPVSNKINVKSEPVTEGTSSSMEPQNEACGDRKLSAHNRRLGSHGNNNVEPSCTAPKTYHHLAADTRKIVKKDESAAAIAEDLLPSHERSWQDGIWPRQRGRDDKSQLKHVKGGKLCKVKKEETQYSKRHWEWDVPAVKIKKEPVDDITDYRTALSPAKLIPRDSDRTEPTLENRFTVKLKRRRKKLKRVRSSSMSSRCSSCHMRSCSRRRQRNDGSMACDARDNDTDVSAAWGLAAAASVRTWATADESDSAGVPGRNILRDSSNVEPSCRERPAAKGSRASPVRRSRKRPRSQSPSWDSRSRSRNRSCRGSCNGNHRNKSRDRMVYSRRSRRSSSRQSSRSRAERRQRRSRSGSSPGSWSRSNSCEHHHSSFAGRDMGHQSKSRKKTSGQHVSSTTTKSNIARGQRSRSKSDPGRERHWSKLTQEKGKGVARQSLSTVAMGSSNRSPRTPRVGLNVSKLKTMIHANAVSNKNIPVASPGFQRPFPKKRQRKVINTATLFWLALSSTSWVSLSLFW